MLIIYSSLCLGGIETFIVRLAKERFRNNLTTKILLLSHVKNSDEELLAEVQQYAQVIFSDNIFYNLTGPFHRVLVSNPLRKKAVATLLNGVEQIHVANGLSGLIGQRLMATAGVYVPLTVGFYHSITHARGLINNAYYHNSNSQFVLDYLPKRNLLCYSDDIVSLFENKYGYDLSDAHRFRIGVVSSNHVMVQKPIERMLKICSIGRIVDFKTYNFFMLDIVASLKAKNIEVEYHIYGDGPMKAMLHDEICKRKLTELVHLKGNLEYSKFDSIVADYDLFIGSGTAIIQTAALGICCIVGIESIQSPETYGYFCDVSKYEYNIDGLPLPKISVAELIVNFMSLTDAERELLGSRHRRATEEFGIELCSQRMDALKTLSMPAEPFKYSAVRYDLSRFYTGILNRLSALLR